MTPNIVLRRNRTADAGSVGRDEGEAIAPGEYVRVPESNQVSKIIWAFVRCPQCLRLSSIGKRHHTVDADGTVKPSLVCPFTADKGFDPACTHHVYARLDDWQG